ncbi:hypothetical protein L9F63_016827, partial [Diploptera punctata]
MEELQDNEGACSMLEHENDIPVGIDTSENVDGKENTAEQQKKKKKTRRRKKSKTKDLNDGCEENIEHQKPEISMNMQSQLKYLGLDYNIEVNEIREEIAKVNIGMENTENSETQATTSTNKKKKKHSKKKQANSVELSPLYSINNEPDTHSDIQNTPNKPRSPNKIHSDVQNTPNKPSSPNKQDKKTPKSSTSKEITTFEDYLLPSEAIAALQQKILISGSIRINQRNYKEAYINAPDKGQDILIEGMRSRNRALEGDEVLVKVNHVSAWRIQGQQKQRTGKVVFIKEQVHPRVSVGFLKPMPDNNQDWALFSPRDSRVPRIKIPMAKCPKDFLKNSNKYKNVLYLVMLEEWKDVRYAEGSILERIGDIGDLKSETVALLLENDIETNPFDIHLYQYFPHSPFVIPEEEMNSRKDL